jgi:hypothetical protein
VELLGLRDSLQNSFETLSILGFKTPTFFWDIDTLTFAFGRATGLGDASLFRLGFGSSLLPLLMQPTNTPT